MDAGQAEEAVKVIFGRSGGGDEPLQPQGAGRRTKISHGCSRILTDQVLENFLVYPVKIGRGRFGDDE
jgi:hypothetical protein